jgi:GNAT superfamily N-acetyltransferase
MNNEITVRRARVEEAPEVAGMVGELLTEIMTATGIPAFNFDPYEATRRLTDFLNEGKYFVFVAFEGESAVGFVTLYESYALYAGGAFGTIPELYVRPPYRSRHVGAQLLASVKAFGHARGWPRLEVTTPPLPQFEQTLAFYEREGFTITGGRKLKVAL